MTEPQQQEPQTPSGEPKEHSEADYKALRAFMRKVDYDKNVAENWPALMAEAQEFEGRTRGLAVEHLYLFTPEDEPESDEEPDEEPDEDLGEELED